MTKPKLLARDLEEVILQIEHEIIDELEYREPGYGMTKAGLNMRIGIDMDFLTIILKRMKKRGVVKIIRFYSEETYRPDGSGYCLTSKNPNL